jgi:cilia- and flagella-associated protein 43
MNMNQDDMNEDQRMRLREFEAKESKLKEEKEKIRKSLESELKKLKSDINDICTKFDDRLFILFRRRLEYEYRIYEQELYIIRLTLSMLMEQQNNAKAYNLQILLRELYNKNEQLKFQRQRLEETKLHIDEEKEKREIAYRDAIDNKKFNRLVLHYSAIFPETEDKKNKDNEAYLKDSKYSLILCKLDPFYENDKFDVKAIHQEVFDNYLTEIEKKLKDDDEADKEKSKNLFLKKFEAKKAFEISKKDQNDIQTYIVSIEKIQQSAEEDMKKKFIKSLIIRERLAKAISNIEIQIRFNQGQVELQHDDPIPRLADAILIRKAIIDNQNHKIQDKGNEKIEKKKEITETNYKVADLKYKIELCKLEIRDIEAKTNEVKRLKVKKEMQAALSKKDPQLSQAELNKLNIQMNKIKDATDKRIQIYLKKEEKVKREKDYLIRENKQLNEQGHALRVPFLPRFLTV